MPNNPNQFKLLAEGKEFLSLAVHRKKLLT